MLNKAYNYFIPKDPKVTTIVDNNGKVVQYCIDSETEKILQRQRWIAMYIVTPLVLYASISKNMNNTTRVLLGSMGIACFLTHKKAYDTIIKNS